MPKHKEYRSVPDSLFFVPEYRLNDLLLLRHCTVCRLRRQGCNANRRQKGRQPTAGRLRAVLRTWGRVRQDLSNTPPVGYRRRCRPAVGNLPIVQNFTVFFFGHCAVDQLQELLFRQMQLLCHKGNQFRTDSRSQ